MVIPDDLHGLHTRVFMQRIVTLSKLIPQAVFKHENRLSQKLYHLRI